MNQQQFVASAQKEKIIKNINLIPAWYFGEVVSLKKSLLKQNDATAPKANALPNRSS